MPYQPHVPYNEKTSPAMQKPDSSEPAFNMQELAGDRTWFDFLNQVLAVPQDAPEADHRYKQDMVQFSKWQQNAAADRANHRARIDMISTIPDVDPNQPEVKHVPDVFVGQDAPEPTEPITPLMAKLMQRRMMQHGKPTTVAIQ